MMRRYVEQNDRVFDDIFARGQELSDDPLQAFLISLKLLAETMADLPGGHPGCLIASVCYQERLFDRDVVELAAKSVRSWNARFRRHIERSRPCIRHASQSTSTIWPTCFHASSMAASSCRRRSTTRAGWNGRSSPSGPSSS